MIRLITSLNWTIGTLAIAAALLYPLVSYFLIVDNVKDAAEEAVLEIAEAQLNYYVVYQEYVYFGLDESDFKRAMTEQLKLQEPSGDFLYQAFGNDEYPLIIRAVTAPLAMSSGWLPPPPMGYLYQVKTAGERGNGSWEQWSNEKPGFF